MSLVHSVLVVGAGPVGLTAALTLARQRFEVTVLEADPAPTTEWRASTFHPPTLEIARDLDVADAMLKQGLIARKYQFRDRNEGILAEFDYGLLDGETEFPFRLQLEQYKYVEILTSALAAYPNATVLRGHRVLTVENRESGGHVQAETSQGRTTFVADFVVAADGAHSTVRHELQIPLEGLTYQHRYLVLSIDADLEDMIPDICAVNYIADPAEHLLVLRIPDLWRVILAVQPSVTDEQALSREYIDSRLKLLTDRDLNDDVRARQVYSVHQRVAERFLVGNVALTGDAAHINSPMGGMGLNSGIHDSFTLAGALAGVRAGDAGKSLANWARVRRTVALDEIRRISHENTVGLAETSEDGRRRWQHDIVQTAQDSDLAKQWLLRASMIAGVRRYQEAR